MTHRDQTESNFNYINPGAKKGLNEEKKEGKALIVNNDTNRTTAVDSLLKAANELYDRINFDPVALSLSRKFLEKFKKEHSNPELNHNKIGFIMIDLNDFKIVNDKEGHVAGDRKLSELTTFLRKFFRKSDEIINLIGDETKNDEVVRYGGDEFVIICHNNNNDENFEDNLLLKIRDIIARSDKPIIFSCGVAVFDKNLDKSIDDTLERADKNMYSHKKEIKKKDTNLVKKIKKIFRIIFDGV